MTVIVSLVWVALLASGLAWEIYSRVDPRRVSVSRIAAAVGASRLGRVLLIAAWAFVGLHLFARYTLPR